MNTILKKIAIPIVGLLLIGGGCQRPVTSNTAPTNTMNQSARGLSFSPLAVTTDGLNDFYDRAALIGRFVSWAGPVSDLAEGKAGRTLVTTIRHHQLTPVVVISPAVDDLTQNQAWESWFAPVKQYAQVMHPEVLCIGNEINKNWTSVSLTAYIQRLQSMVEALHAVSPQTQVCTTLQYEWLAGYRGGQFGGKNDPAQAQWSLLSELTALDIIGFTTYPSLVFSTAAEIPATYYSAISNHTTKPIAFTEVGWSRVVGGAEQQATFITAFRSAASRLNPTFMIWSFLYDPVTKAPFDSMGLLDTNETTSAAWSAWRQ